MNQMNVKLLLPFQDFAEIKGVSRIVAEIQEGSFGLLPHRLDCVLALSPGVLVCQVEDEAEAYIAVDHGVLVKAGSDVFISVRRALRGSNLEALHDAVEQEFSSLNERERGARDVMTGLEAGFMNRLAGFPK